MANEHTLKFEAPDQGEDLARADLYGLLAGLLYTPPSQELLDQIAAATVEGEGLLEQAWRGLSAASREIGAEQAREEYDELFIGVGKPEVMLYGSYYLSGFLMEKPLAQLRADMASLGLERADSMVESEDHIASLCEVMRYLIASEEGGGLTVQKWFFVSHIQRWAEQMCQALLEHPRAKYYGAVGELARSFFAVETQAFDMS